MVRQPDSREYVGGLENRVGEEGVASFLHFIGHSGVVEGDKLARVIGEKLAVFAHLAGVAGGDEQGLSGHNYMTPVSDSVVSWSESRPSQSP